MGGSHSREGNLSESESESESEPESEEHPQEAQSPTTSLDSIDSKLKSLDLQSPNTNPSSIKLYLYAGGKWILSEKLTAFSFTRSDDSQAWFLVIGSKIRARIEPQLQLKLSPDQLRCDFVADGVWALKFFSRESFDSFRSQFNGCLFENAYGFEANEENFTRVFGEDFAVWAKPEKADDSIWEDAEENFERVAPVSENRNLFQEFEEVASEGSKIQSLALGALDNSFLVGDSSVQVVRNFSHGVHGKGMTVKYSGGSNFGGFSAPKKALLMKAESNMLLMSPGDQERLEYSTGVHQLDIESGKIVTEWKFEKDGTDITMRDITNDSKGSQLDSSESTFLGLDDNRLCRWDMRDKRGIVQNIDSSLVLEWMQGHQFGRGTNFRCFASTGDGSIVVGSLDGKIRLYSKSSMRMAKTVFPGLGSPITHVDVTYDGKWILGTTDTYLILISTVCKDKDGKEKTGFNGRMGSRIAAPRLLKLTPLDAHLAGKDSKFHGGQFSWVTENGKQERHLVGTVGKFSIIWDFRQVKKSKHECYRSQEGLKSCYCYRIVLRDESIVDSRFMHEKFAVSDSPEAPLVVATPMKVSSFSMSNNR